ncbi:hypothetical protein JHL17_13360 [Azospirillum sp. YIM B02556]|uniref:Uncharacterized protein n=1 Tax=Azospirillum endophyticum TaxID=2800326 RepID=A0ABS1F4S2_9PROT|nr:hypothetical protein [Azospirillum endophyticum]MBK1838402.1 hypothetical protein [Azospirillum endophyticum]
MHPVERMLTDALAEGREPTLSEVGGARALADARADLVRSDWMHELLRIAVMVWPDAGPEERSDLAAFIAACAQAPFDGIVARDAVLTVCRGELPQDLLTTCFRAFLDRAADRSAEPPARWWALYGAWDLTRDDASRKYRFLAALEDTGLDDVPSYLRHVAAIAGAAHARWREEPMLERLRRLCDIQEARDEAAFALGMAALATALEAAAAVEAEERFGRAESWFTMSIAAREGRSDAEAYRAAVRAVLAFRRGAAPDTLAGLADELHRAATMYLTWNADEDDPPLLSQRLTEAACWQSLAAKLGGLAQRLELPAWLDPSAVLESEVFAAYVAGRSFLGRAADGGLEALVRPRIEDAVLARRHQLCVLDQWLAEKAAGSDWAGVADDLRRRLREREAEDSPGNCLGTPPKTSLAASR